MTKYLSDKIRNLSAFSILLVIYIHMYYTEGETMPTLMAIERFVGSGICSIAVPLFYIISGYLFFLSMPKGIVSIKDKLIKRCRTLLVPYLLANSLTFLFYLAIGLISLKVAAIGNVVNFNVITDMKQLGVIGTLELVFISPPIAFQLWFVRDLMCVMLLSPIIYLIIDKLTIRGGKFVPFLLLAIYVFLYKWPLATAFVWFSLGAYIHYTKFDIERRVSMPIALCAMIFFILMCYLTIIDILVIAHYIPLVGIPVVWMVYDYLFKHIRIKNVQYLTGCSFFIYLIHEPLLNVFKKLPLLVDKSQPVLIACYLLIPPIFYIFGCILSIILKKMDSQII